MHNFSDLEKKSRRKNPFRCKLTELAENKACNCSQITLFTMQCLKKDMGHDTEQYVLDLK